MRALQSVLFVFMWFSYVLQCNCDPDCESAAKSPTMTLKHQLFCGYDTTVRPVKEHTTVTTVNILLWVKYMIFNEHFNTLEIHSWLTMTWKDEHLTWDKNEHSQIKDLAVLSSELWVPDITAYTTANMNSVDTRIPETRCNLKNDGEVHCESPIHMTAICVPDITRWPFDSHKCTMRMGSWSRPDNQMNITLEDKGISIKDYAENRDWELLNSSATRKQMDFDNLTHPWINFRFDLKRHPGGHAASVVAPSIVLAILTLVTFWLDPLHSHRVGLICVNITCHCMYLMFLCLMLPGNGDSTPIIVTFFRDSLLLAGVSLLVAICAGSMNKTARAPPSWIVSITDIVLASCPGQFFLLGETDPKAIAAVMVSPGAEDGAELVGSSSAVNGWTIFSTLLDRVCFVIFTLTLFILLCAYVP